MHYILTIKIQYSKKCKDGKYRNFLLFFLNDVKILTQKNPYDESYYLGYDKRLCYKNIFLLNNNLYQTRYDEKRSRDVKFPVSKKILKQFDIPKNMKIELSEHFV